MVNIMMRKPQGTTQTLGLGTQTLGEAADRQASCPPALLASGLRACSQCQRGAHNKCTGRRHIRLERRHAPCECKECQRERTKL